MTTPHDESLMRSEAVLADRSDTWYEMTLIVSGASDLSARATVDARRLCEAHLEGRYHLSVVDLREAPAASFSGQVLAAPTLVRNRPLPVRRFVGDLSRSEEVLRVLGLPVAGAADDADQTIQISDAPSALAEADDALRSLQAGEIDAFAVSDGGSGRRVFTLSTADAPYRMFVENMRDGAATLSSGGLILHANRRLAELLARSRESIVGSPLASFVSGQGPVELEQIRGPAGVGATFELDLVDALGVAVPVLVGTSPLEVDGEPVTCMTFTDISVLKAQDRESVRLSVAQAERMDDLVEAQAALTKQATHDSLTGLPNRALLVDRIDQALLQAARSGRCIAVLFVDLDRFKQINDSKGHAVGDAVLRKVARRLVGALRSMDTVARIGGDEFVILAPDVGNQAHAADLGARVVTELQHETDGVDDGERVSASIGISVSVAGRGTAETMIHEADTAMYHAKSLGGGCLEVFDDRFGRQAQARSTAQRTLEAALDEHRVFLCYQPIIDLATGRVAGLEALARIADHDGTVLLPAAFIPVAEESGLVLSLGAHVLEMACHEARTWLPAGGREHSLSLAVNLSARQFEPGDLATILLRTLEQTGLDPERLHVELTENAIIDLRPDILQQLGSISDLGVQIGLDDFGTGYASLTHLRRLPLSFVKIHQSFVQGLGADPQDDRVVAAVVSLAANLGLRSIAEGVETQVQLGHLRDLGCDQAQGFHLARPLPADEVPAAIHGATWEAHFHDAGDSAT